MIFGLVLIAGDAIFFIKNGGMNLFLFVMGLGISVMLLPFIIDLVLENKREQQINEMFLEFSRNLAESVNTGTPISKSIINMRSKNYGVLTPHIQKLANQIFLGIPVAQALHTFAYDVGSPVITRAVTLISEAEKAGGEIDYILASAAKSIAEVEKLKTERKAAIYSLVVQGYIIFFIFIAIMLVMEHKILPLVSGVGSFGGLNTDFNQAANEASANTNPISPANLASPFLYLLLSQGFFAGLIIGKLTEGRVKSGIKHSFILTITAFLVSTGVRVAVS